MGQGKATVELDLHDPLWERFFLIAPLILVGTREADGHYDLAPKHMAMPVSWDNHFGFVCAPSHGTYVNAVREREFTVSYPTPDQLVMTSLMAAPRRDDGTKPNVRLLALAPAKRVSAPLVEGASLQLECRLERTVDGLGLNSLVIGRVIAAHAPAAVLRASERDDADLLREHPLLAYLHPGRFAVIADSRSFPMPADMRR
jgi:flavin reductase (DIM6/NTAB) family NADH-FMN oxidoreductase RutF